MRAIAHHRGGHDRVKHTKPICDKGKKRIKIISHLIWVLLMICRVAWGARALAAARAGVNGDVLLSVGSCHTDYKLS